MPTGRTSPRFSKFQIEDTGGILRDIPVKTFGNIGLTYDEIDLAALQDTVKGFVSGQTNFGVTITGPFDTSAAVASSTTGQASGAHLSGSHTVLEPLNGGLISRAFGIYLGIQADWASGDPVFGGNNAVIVTDYTVDPATGMYSAKLVHIAGGTAPDWGTAQIVVA